MSRQTIRAVGYCRFSQDDQKKGFSIETQKERLKTFCEVHKEDGWKLINIYEDRALTGTDTDRPGYKQMIDEIGAWDICLAVKPDRFHRSAENFDRFVKTLRENHKQAWTLDGRLDTVENAGAWFAQYIVARGLPEFEARQISERTLPGIKKAKDSGTHVGRAPIGFYWNRDVRRLMPSAWGQKIKDDYDRLEDIDEVRLLNPYPERPEPKLKFEGQPPSRAVTYRILRNFRLYESGDLIPNRESSESGTHSKYKGEYVDHDDK